MTSSRKTVAKTPVATWIGLGVALFGILLARWFSSLFFPPLSVAIAAGGATLTNRFMAGEALIWLCVALLLLLVRWGERRPFSSVGLGNRPLLKRSVPWGVLLAVLCAGVGAVVSTLTHFQGGETVQALLKLPLWLVLVVVMTAGIAEELFYRGYAIERLEQLGLNRYLAGGIPLLVFGLAHATNGLANVLIALALGAVLTVFYFWRRDLVANMIGHFLVDFVSVVPVWLAAHH